MKTLPPKGPATHTRWGVVLKPVPRKAFSEIVTMKSKETIELTNFETNGNPKKIRKESKSAEKISIISKEDDKVKQVNHAPMLNQYFMVHESTLTFIIILMIKIKQVMHDQIKRKNKSTAETHKSKSGNLSVFSSEHVDINKGTVFLLFNALLQPYHSTV